MHNYYNSDLDRIKTLMLLNKRFNMFMANTYFLECWVAVKLFWWLIVFSFLFQMKICSFWIWPPFFFLGFLSTPEKLLRNFTKSTLDLNGQFLCSEKCAPLRSFMTLLLTYVCDHAVIYLCLFIKTLNSKLFIIDISTKCLKYNET